MAILAAALAVIVILVWAGRRPVRLRAHLRVASALLGALAAAAAVVSGLRGGWLASLALLALSAWLAASARPSSAASEADRPAMSLEEARSILGVGPLATPAEVEEAWRRLIRRAHPDRGGTAGLAAQLNAARDRLVKRSGR
ncbi:MAG: J domain-containing protein [Caulobacteraceae bacterium]